MTINQKQMIEQEYVPFATEILVSDFETSLDFYKKLQFDVVRINKSDDYDFATLSFNNSIVMIKEDPRVKKKIDGSIIQLRFIVEDLKKFYKYVQSQNVAIFKPLDKIYYGLTRFSVSDPDGYEIKFGQGITTGNSVTKTIQFRLKIYPKNFYKVKDFYENVLNYPIIDSWDNKDDKGVMFNSGAAIIEIMTPRKGFTPPIKGVGLALMVEDVWSLWDKLKDTSSIIKPLGSPSAWRDVGFRIEDPGGLKITFFSPNSKKPK